MKCLKRHLYYAQRVRSPIDASDIIPSEIPKHCNRDLKSSLHDFNIEKSSK